MNKKFKYNFYYIYLTKNLVNGKSYVGWHATDVLYDGYLGSGIALKKAIKKYGKDFFINGILEFCKPNNIFEKEIEWIEKLKTYGKGYNLTKGGDGCLGLKHSIESRKIMSEKHSGKILSKDHKKNIGKSLEGNINIGGWNKNLHWDEKTKNKISIGNLNKTLSDKSKMHMSESKKKLYSNKINHPRSKIWIVHTPEDKFLCIGTFRKFRDKNKTIYNKYFQKIIETNSTIDGWYFQEFQSIEEIPNMETYKLFSINEL